MILAALALAAGNPAVMIIMNGSQTTISYPSMKRCLAAKAELERQYQDSYNRDLARGIMRPPPVVYCVPK